MSKRQVAIKDRVAYQRVIRLCPDESDAMVLLDNGLDSCMKITTLNRRVFIDDYGRLLGTNGTDVAEDI